MNSLPTATAFPKRLSGAAFRTGWVAVAALALALSVSGCRSEAQDRNYDFNNPVDPNLDTGTGGGTGTGQLVISLVNTDPDVVVIVNTGIEPTDMSNWTLENDDTTPAKYTFSSGFTLNQGGFVRVFSSTGTDSATDLYIGSTTPNWGPTAPNNVARLKNASGTTIFTCQVGNLCWN